MAVTDLFLRSKPKLQVTDLWLHPAGPSGSLPPFIYRDGTVTTVGAHSASEALGETSDITSLAGLAALEALAQEAALTTLTQLAGVEALAQRGDLVTVAVLAADETLVIQTTATTVRLLLRDHPRTGLQTEEEARL